MAVKKDNYKVGDTKVYSSEAAWRSAAKKASHKTTRPSSPKPKKRK